MFVNIKYLTVNVTRQFGCNGNGRITTKASEAELRDVTLTLHESNTYNVTIEEQDDDTIEKWNKFKKIVLLDKIITLDIITEDTTGYHVTSLNNYLKYNFNSEDIDIENNLIKIPNHQFSNNFIIQYTNGSESNKISELEYNTNYYVYVYDKNHIILYNNSFNENDINSENSKIINLSGVGSGSHTIKNTPQITFSETLSSGIDLDNLHLKNVPSGKCLCDVRFTGEYCNQCADNYYDYVNGCIRYCSDNLTNEEVNYLISNENSFQGTPEEERISRLTLDSKIESLRDDNSWNSKTNQQKFDFISNSKSYITIDDFKNFYFRTISDKQFSLEIDSNIQDNNNNNIQFRNNVIYHANHSLNNFEKIYLDYEINFDESRYDTYSSGTAGYLSISINLPNQINNKMYQLKRYILKVPHQNGVKFMMLMQIMLLEKHIQQDWMIVVMKLNN